MDIGLERRCGNCRLFEPAMSDFGWCQQDELETWVGDEGSGLFYEGQGRYCAVFEPLEEKTCR